MILELFVSLTLLSLFTFIFIPSRGRRLWAAAVMLIGAALFYYMYLSFQRHDTSHFVFQWLPYAGLKASLYLSADKIIEQMLLPVLGTALLLIYFNVIYPFEKRKLSLNGLILLSVSAFILLASARDCIQLMVGSCAYTIIGFYLIDSMDWKKKYLFYNFIGEMSLFTALAVVYSYVGTIDIAQSQKLYLLKGGHKDLVSVLLMIAIFAKAGVFPFQNQMLDTQELSFNRSISLTTIMTPLAALLVLTKINTLLMGASFSKEVIIGICTISGLWALWGMLAIDSIKAKVLYINMMFFAGFLATLSYNMKALSEALIYFIPMMVLLNYLLVIVFVAASKEVYVSQMGGFIKKMKLSFLLSVGGIALFLSLLSVHKNALPQYGAEIFGILLILGWAHILRSIYFGKSGADDKVEALLRNAPLSYILPLMAALGWGFYKLWQPQNQLLYQGLLLFFAVLVVFPFRIFNRWAENEIIQDGDWVEKLYSFFILMPVRLLGRILWLTIDFLFIERTIIGSVSETTNFMVRHLRKIQTASLLNYLFMVLVGVSIFIFCIGRHYYE